MKNVKFEQSHKAEKCKKGRLWAFSTSILLQSIKTLKEALRRHWKIFEEKVSQSRKGGSLIVPKNGKEGPFCFRIVLYYMLEGLDAFKMKY